MAFIRALRCAARRSVAVVVLVAALPATAQAASTWTVNTTSDPAGPGCARSGTCSIRQALSAAGPGDAVVIPANGSHYTLTRGELAVTQPSLTITGAGEGATVIDASATSRVLLVNAPAGTTTTLSGVTLTRGSVTAPGAFQGGAGIYLQSGNLGLTGVAVTGNSVTLDPASAGDGGGGILDVSPGSLTLTQSAVVGNSVKLTGGGPGGGGILDLSGPLVLAASSVEDNSLSVSNPSGGTDGGGGIYAGAAAQLTIAGSTIAANAASIRAAGGSNGGAAIYDGAGASRYVNDTLSANALTVNAGASNGGGAIFHAGAPGTISNATIAQNTANGPGGAIFDNARAYTVKNTIVAQNGTGCAGPGGIVSAGFNLDGSNTCGMNMPTDLRNTNPRLGPLTSNGGSTLTHALTPASPAIDAGSCTDAAGIAVTSDERGEPRPQPVGGRCDIGAFEYAPASRQPLIVGGSRPVVLASTRASFGGIVNPGGLRSTARFEYGLDPRYRPPGKHVYDHFTRAVAVGGGYRPAKVTATVGGLVPAALYHVRLIVTNAAGSAIGPDQTFVTAKDRSPQPPMLGRYVTAAPATGLVRVLVGGTFVPLTEPGRFRVGTEFDARRGTVVITAAAVRGRIMATLGGAVFRLGQAAFGPDRALPVAALADGAFAGVPSYAGCHSATTRVLQTLHTSAGGAFRVRGRYSAGTVSRRAQWATSDRCDGTLTAVRRGPVAVRNLRRPHASAVSVRSGRTYVVRR